MSLDPNNLGAARVEAPRGPQARELYLANVNWLGSLGTWAWRWIDDLLSGDAAQPPAVVTLDATAVAATSVVANATVNPQGQPATVYFEYGTDTTYGSQTATQALLPGSTVVPVAATISGLSAVSTLHFRVVASSVFGTVRGDDLTVETYTLCGTPASPPMVTADPASAVTTSSATITGTANPNGLATTVLVSYGPDTDYGAQTVPISVGAGCAPVAFSVPLAGLPALADTHFRVSASNSRGSASSDDQVLTTTSPCGGALTAPVVVTGSSSGVDTTSAVVAGTVNPNGQATSVVFEYGPDTSYGSSVSATTQPDTVCTPVTVSAVLSGLPVASVTHWRISATNTTGTSTGSDASLTTLTTSGCPPAAPTITGTPTGVTTTPGTGATITAVITANGLATSMIVDYGPTAAYGSTVTLAAGAACAAATVSASISGLAQAQQYHFRVTAQNTSGSVQTGDLVVATNTKCGAPPAAPTLGILAATLGSTSVTVNATVNPNGQATTMRVDYGPDTGYGSTVTVDAGDACSAGTVSAPLAGLDANTPYHYRVTVQNATGSNASSDQTFTTYTICGGPAAAPITSDASISETATLATVNGSVNPNGFDASVVAQYKPTAADWSTASSTAVTTLPAGCAAVPTSIPLPSLPANASYDARLRSSSAPGATTGGPVTFITPGTPSVATSAATSVSSSGATLNGSIDNHGAAGTAYFEYGATTSYGTRTATQIIGAGSSPVSAVVTGLASGATIHFRLVFARDDGGGSATTADATFTTSGGLAATDDPDSASFNPGTYTGSGSTNNITPGRSWIAKYRSDANTRFGLGTRPAALIQIPFDVIMSNNGIKPFTKYRPLPSGMTQSQAQTLLNQCVSTIRLAGEASNRPLLQNFDIRGGLYVSNNSASMNGGNDNGVDTAAPYKYALRNGRIANAALGTAAWDPNDATIKNQLASAINIDAQSGWLQSECTDYDIDQLELVYPGGDYTDLSASGSQQDRRGVWVLVKPTRKPTSGTWSLTISWHDVKNNTHTKTISGIAWNATAAQVQSAITTGMQTVDTHFSSVAGKPDLTVTGWQAADYDASFNAQWALVFRPYNALANDGVAYATATAAAGATMGVRVDSVTLSSSLSDGSSIPFSTTTPAVTKTKYGYGDALHLTKSTGIARRVVVHDCMGDVGNITTRKNNATVGPAELRYGRAKTHPDRQNNVLGGNHIDGIQSASHDNTGTARQDFNPWTGAVIPAAANRRGVYAFFFDGVSNFNVFCSGADGSGTRSRMVAEKCLFSGTNTALAIEFYDHSGLVSCWFNHTDDAEYPGSGGIDPYFASSGGGNVNTLIWCQNRLDNSATGVYVAAPSIGSGNNSAASLLNGNGCE